MSNTASGVAGRSDDRKANVRILILKKLCSFGSIDLTCLQVPEVFAADLVVPVLAESISAAPNVKPGADVGGAVSSPGSGPAGVQVVVLRGLDLDLQIVLLFRAGPLPAQGVCDTNS